MFFFESMCFFAKFLQNYSQFSFIMVEILPNHCNFNDFLQQVLNTRKYKAIVPKNTRLMYYYYLALFHAEREVLSRKTAKI